ncbi:gluconeogenesis factor YvcK family protein [Algibacillus agarilyticus]|uniref:gluconeogenesis factor YvcK family protein n=1 Tax=Algibacillus agarilyticus TaxID=2234133 RepID=UPI000DCF9D7A|nr:uridine diphosphate-N-acetylglucosamine-binding protein YvcK [Algibacillus agarilyticus]
MHSKEFNLVAIGGGHGLGKVLNTFSNFGPRLSGIVATTDNGGSTGRLRESKDTIAWGDLRNCLSHLAGHTTLGAQLLEFRFTGEGLNGHSMGNLLFYALEELRYSPVEVIELVRRMMKVESRLYPMSEQPTHLKAITETGEIIIGETNIDSKDIPIPKDLQLTDQVFAPSRVIRAIYAADYILLGPGSFFTSVLPPLLVHDLCNAVCSSKAKIILIDNLGKEIGPANEMTLNDKIKWLNTRFPKLKIHKVLTDVSRNIEGVPADLLFQASLSEADVFYRHDEVKLRMALEKIFCLTA